MDRRKRFASILLCLGLVWCIPISGFAKEEEKETVRVAYFDLGEYYQVQEDGEVVSYDAAYLDMIAQYTNLSFEYVDCKTWKQALEMLRNHEIDLVGTMQWTWERENTYEICDSAYGYTVAELASLPDSDLIYEDYSSINGAIVGHMEGYVIEERLPVYMKQHNLTFQIKKYQKQAELDAALRNGEIDLLAGNSHVIRDDWKIIDKFAYAPFHFASWKGNEELTSKISEAIIQINIHQSDFDDTLIREYFPIMVNSPYNKEEMECINQQQKYTIYFDSDTKPLVWYDREANAMKGVLVDICYQVADVSGLQFDIKPTPGTVDKTDPNNVTYRTLYYGKSMNYSNEQGVTNAILNQTFKLFHKVGEDYEIGGVYEIGIVKSREGIREYLQEQYPSCKLVEYDTPEACMLALSKRKVDLTFLNSHVADNIIITDSMSDITAVPMSEMIMGIALEFHGEDAKLLSEIVDKSMQLLDTGEINEAMLSYAMNTAPKITFRYLINHHPGIAAMGTVMVILVVVVCISLMMYARLMREDRNRMEEINQERSDFFARMSHDMRTPMNGILGMLDLTDRTSNLEEIRSNTKKAKQSGEYMLSLINDILDLQRLESQKLTLEPQVVQVGEFIENIKEMIKPSAELKNIHFIWKNINIHDEDYINIDQVRVKQIFVNILSNAVKFTPEQGTIETIVECLEIRNNVGIVKVQIRDTGVGMSQDFVEKNLFKPYSQELNKMTSHYAGSGLGLAIVKNLVTMMGGTISVDSRKGEGTTFTVILDFPCVDKEIVKEALKNQDGDRKDIRDKLKGKNILICEDHSMNAEIARRVMEAAECQVTIAENGLIGLEMFKKAEPYTFDAILMDIRMPEMDGLETTRLIRALDRPDAKTIPIIAMTANAYESDKENSRNAGMNDHLAKPIEVEEMYRKIAKYL